MTQPILVLQYPDPRQCRTVALAVTRNPEALLIFKKVVLQEAWLNCLSWDGDEVLSLQERTEADRLQRLLDLLIPDAQEGESCAPR